MIIINEINSTVRSGIYQIKSAMSYDNNFFICIIKYNNYPCCFINEYSSNELKEINCPIYDSYDLDYKVFYFNETNEFMMVSRISYKTTLYHNLEKKVNLCNADFFNYPKDSVYDFSIIYNKNYLLINYLNYESEINQIIIPTSIQLHEEQLKSNSDTSLNSINIEETFHINISKDSETFINFSALTQTTNSIQHDNYSDYSSYFQNFLVESKNKEELILYKSIHS